MRTLLSLLAALGILTGDQSLKQRSEENRLPSRAKDTGGSLSFSNYHNKGAALNMGEKTPLFVTALALSLTVFCTILFLFTLGKKGSGLLKTGLSLILGGAYSNLYDRIKYGYVIDYIALRLPKDGVKTSRGVMRELVWNIADLAIAAGAMLLVIGKNDWYE